MFLVTSLVWNLIRHKKNHGKHLSNEKTDWLWRQNYFITREYRHPRPRIDKCLIVIIAIIIIFFILNIIIFNLRRLYDFYTQQKIKALIFLRPSIRSEAHRFICGGWLI